MLAPWRLRSPFRCTIHQGERFTSGIGRIFALRPSELLQAINRYEQPLVLTPAVASGALFLGTDATRNVSYLVNRSIYPKLAPWFGNQLRITDAKTQGWGPQDFITGLSTNRFVSAWSHTTHQSFTIDDGRSMRAQDLSTLEVHQPTVVVGFGCHLGLSVSNTPDGGGVVTPFANTLIHPLVSQGVTVFAPISEAYTFNSNFPAASLHELMVTLFTNKLLDTTIPTTGDVWRSIYPGYHATDPGFVDNSNPATHTFHVTGAYGMVLYGLPTQRIERQRTDLASVTTMYHGKEVPQGKATATNVGVPDTLTIDIPRFEAHRQDDGTTLFSVPNGGTHIAPASGHALPLVVRSLTLPNHEIVTGVRLTQSSSTIYDEPILLPEYDLETGNSEPVTGTLTLPDTYPERIFQYSVAPEGDGSRLTLSVIPMQYDSRSRNATLYNHLEFKIETIQSFPANGPALTRVDINRGQPIRINQPGQPIQVDIASPDDDLVSLLWSVHDPRGYTIDSGQAPVQVIAGTSTVQFTLDTSEWTPGQKDVSVYLKRDDALLSSSNHPIIAQGVALEEPTPTIHSYSANDAEALWNLMLSDEQGQLIPGRAGAFEVLVDGQPQPIQVTEQSPGYYQARLGLADLLGGNHQIQIAVTDARGIKGVRSWQLIKRAFWVAVPVVQR